MKNILKKIDEKIVLIYSVVLITLFMNTDFVFADDLLNNPITEGVKKMIKDGTTLIMGTTGLATIMLIIQQVKRHYTGDEMEAKQCNKKSLVILISWIIVMTASIIFKIVGGYFGIKGA